ncbi:phage antirepressor KilAC domain-containing protein [Azotobacter salinestris]|uniref:phage antirepressor KilAC domain-containing protein n=1 Tax=Azotobacter salinestris TaxID=69964 RepID=UPI001266959E|nr:phage antirepressor KilAC domain-containing protein [Azotobacter salinestris]
MEEGHSLYRQSSPSQGQSTTIAIRDHQMSIVEYQGQRVVTLAMIDEVHKRPKGTAKRNFNKNKTTMIDEEDYFLVPHSQKYEIRTFGIEVPSRGLILLTESGYLMLVKSLNDDLAWKVYRQLVKSYFRHAAAPAELSRLELLEMALASEREKIQAIAERDHAISDLEAAKPAVEFFDSYAKADGLMTFRQVAKLLDANEREFRRFLVDQRIMHLLNGEWTPYQPRIKAGYFKVKIGINERNNHTFKQALFTPKGIEWIAGLWRRRMEDPFSARGRA